MLEENKIYFKFNKSKLIDNFNNYSNLGNIYYPLKTNSNRKVLEALTELNSGFLITTLDNFNTLKQLNVDMNKVCVINVLSEKETIKYYYDNGVKFFTFDNMNSLLEFAKYADLSETRIVIRISTMQMFPDEISHLGTSFEETIEMINFLKDKCNKYGIAFYIQNSLKHEEGVLENIFDYIVKKYSNLGLKFVNVGGVNLSDKACGYQLDKIKETLNLEEIILECGRDLVKDTLELETRVIREKTIDSKKIVIIKNGIYSGFFHGILYNQKFDIYLKIAEKEIKLEYEKVNDDALEVLVYGGSSESGDKIGKMYLDARYQDRLVGGAKIIVKNVGAYFEEFFMSYASDLECVLEEC